jgi:hypothetical protein
MSALRGLILCLFEGALLGHALSLAADHHPWWATFFGIVALTLAYFDGYYKWSD